MSNVLADGTAVQRSEARWNAGRDIAAAVMLAIALLLPWNLSFGFGVPEGSTWLFLPLIAVTVLSWAGLVVSHVGQRGRRSVATPSDGAVRIRAALSAPYLLMVSGFVVFVYLQMVQFGGTGDVPTGIGPGLLVGAAGALLAAQPSLQDRPDRWRGAVRAIGYCAMGLVTAAVLANLYWRTRFPLAAISEGTYSGQNVVVVATAVVYGVVAWILVLVGLRWLVSDRQSARLATVALGAATVLGTSLVWVLGVGRDIDAFHGIAQTTSTVAIGFEGYLAWVAAAALVAPWALRSAWAALPTRDDWREAIRSALMLIGLWCGGSAVLRIFDMIVTASLDMPFSPYDSVALLAFDVVTAAAALWIRYNINGTALHPAVLSAGAGVLAVLTICRVVVGVGLAPRMLYTGEPPALQNSVYGNMLAQQITSNFDVIVCWLAVAVALTAVIVLQRGGKRRSAPAESAQPGDVLVTAAVPTAAPATLQSPPVGEVVTAPTLSMPGAAAPKIARSPEPATQKVDVTTKKTPRITRVLEESTQRFAAGTTYTGSGPTPPPSER